MSPANIGRALLIDIVSRVVPAHGINIAGYIAEMIKFYGLSPETSLAISEGLAYLQRAGYLVPNIHQNSSQFFLVSRDGKLVAESSDSTDWMSESVAVLLHHRVTVESVPELEARPIRYDRAVFEAFRALEIDVRKKAGLADGVYGINVFNLAFGANNNGRRGVLTPEPLDAGEAKGYRDLFAGAYSLYRNRRGHRDIEHDPAQAIRLLLLASALFDELDQLDVDDSTLDQ